MLFNSYVYLLIYLPVVVILYNRIRETRYRDFFVVFASTFFYGWWNPAFVPVLLFSVLANYAFAGWIFDRGSEARSARHRVILSAAIAMNLIVLGYFKYAFFLSQIASDATGLDLRIQQIALPLGISFFTFHQIGFLVDVYNRTSNPQGLTRYAVFVTFFPQLIVGPIVRYNEIAPQFSRDIGRHERERCFAMGATLLAIGLFKKTVIADRLAHYVDGVFNSINLQTNLTFVEGWAAGIGYTCQLYFDFSAYADMAMGSALLLGIRLPMNFYSPLRATSITEFWRRWHITLGRFFRLYFFTPLSLWLTRIGARRKWSRSALFWSGVAGPSFVTFFLIGIWHGAGWVFVVFGIMHAGAIVAHQIWRQLFKLSMPTIPAWLLTFLFVVVSLTCFRADDMRESLILWTAMAGLNGLDLPPTVGHLLGPLAGQLAQFGIRFNGTFLNWFAVDWRVGVPMIAISLFAALLLPNVHQMMIRTKPALEIYEGKIEPAQIGWLAWAPNRNWVWATSLLFVIGLLEVNKAQIFLYFQF